MALHSELPADRRTQIALMNKLCAAFADRVAMSSIRFASVEKGEHAGSGCLLGVAGRLFALTASHVVKKQLLQEMKATKHVLVGWGARDARESAPIVRILLWGHERPISEEDAAIVELNSKVLEKIPSACVLTLDDLYPLSEETPLASGELVGVVGTPSAFCAPTSPYRSDQSSHVLAYVNPVDGVDHDMGERLLVRLSSGFTTGGAEAVPPSPDGMSGGAVWWIPAGSPSVKETVERARVVGIQLAVNESQSLIEMAEPSNPPQRTLMIGPIRHWMNLLMNIDEELANSVTCWLADLNTSGSP